MSEMVSLPVNAIADADRRSLENLLGHALAADQQVCVMVFSAATAADAEARRKAVENIRRTMEKVDQYQAARGMGGDEVEAAIDEAMDHVRPRRG
jgi:hypothetical protein